MFGGSLRKVSEANATQGSLLDSSSTPVAIHLKGFPFFLIRDTPERFLDRLRAVGNFLNAKNSTNISLFLSYDDMREKREIKH